MKNIEKKMLIFIINYITTMIYCSGSISNIFGLGSVLQDANPINNQFCDALEAHNFACHNFKQQKVRVNLVGQAFSRAINQLVSFSPEDAENSNAVIEFENMLRIYEFEYNYLKFLFGICKNKYDNLLSIHNPRI